jgi:Amt family ammonium transporter
MFNGGSSLKISGSAGGDAQRAMMNTILAPSAAGIFTFFVKKYISGDKVFWNSIINIRMDFQGLTNGILAGLVSVTASCNAIEPWAAIVIGIMGSIIYSLMVRLLNKLKIDDPLEAFQVHGACGFWGCIATALFKKEEGIFYGGENAGKLLLV